PQLAVLGPWKTELGMVNYSSQPVIVTISVYKPDGSLYDPTDVQNNPVTRSLGGGQSLNEDVAQMFGFSGAQTLDGWLQVEATSESINGFISYGLPSSGSIASVTSSGQGQKRGIFSHIATVGGFFTGVAILNSGQLATNVRILAIQPSGEILGSFNTVLQPGERLSKLINELIPEAAGQGGGLIWVKSALPVHLTSLFGSAGILANIPAQAAPDSYQPDAVLASLKVSPSLAIVQLGQSQTFQMTGATGSVLWKVNGESGGNPSIGTISGQGVYQAPAAVPDPRVLTVTGEVSGQVAGASVDVLEKETLLTSTAIVQSVAYLGSLRRLYTAELEVLGSAGEGPQAAGTPTQQVAKSEIFEVAAGGIKTSVVSFPGEEIAKMISFLASNGKELLLLAAKTSGKVIRLDPTTKETTDVATGLNQPDALVIDAVSGDLLVAELDKITTVARTQLEAGLSPAARGSQGARGDQAAELFPAQGASGIAVNNCTRNVFISNKQTGEILEYVRASGELRTVVTGLQQPTQLLAIYRAGVSCPDSFHLLVIEHGTDRILLILPLEQLATPWIAARQSTDIAFLPGGNPFATSEAILLAEAVEAQQTQQNGGFAISAVTIPKIYRAEPVNIPPIEKPEPEAKAVVEVTVVSQQGFVAECTDRSTVESQFLLDARFQGELEQNLLPSISGSFTGGFQESFQGTGIFSQITSETCTLEGSFQVVINQPAPAESPTDLAGSWTFLLEGIETCDDGSVETLREAFKFDVTQFGNEFSGSFLVGSDFFLPPECTGTCPNPGECTAECPGLGTSCTIGCDPATPGCAEQIQISGTVGSVVAFTVTSQEVFVIECADGSTGEARTSVELNFQGELPQNDVRLISGAFAGDGTESCQGTGSFSQVQCSGQPETFQGSFEVVIRQAQPPKSSTDIGGSWTVIVFDQDGEDDEDNFFEFDVTQTGNEVSGSFLDQEEVEAGGFFLLPQECTVTCPNPGECTAECPTLGTCTITCDPATPNCAEEIQVRGTVR
ncbi:hypothetical protein MYX75_12610, partial [Acidobacteria bacterium AH-259-A15]|nr:hypothetical protein [Acidobacteria bacterium AH-259-A15]